MAKGKVTRNDIYKYNLQKRIMARASGSSALISRKVNTILNNYDLLVNALQKLKTIAELKDNWNNNGAKSFDRSLISQCYIIVSMLVNYPPEIFPVADNSIQMEYDGNAGSYLQFRIYENKIREFRVFSNGKKLEKYINEPDIVKEVKSFYGLTQRQREYIQIDQT